MKNQPIYLSSQILIEMIRILFFLFNNHLELDAYIAIESISDKAEEEMMIDVILVCQFEQKKNFKLKKLIKRCVIQLKI